MLHGANCQGRYVCVLNYCREWYNPMVNELIPLQTVV